MGETTSDRVDGPRALAVCSIMAVYGVYQVALQALPSVMVGRAEDPLRLDSATFGIFASAFFFTYLPGQLVAGVLLDRLAARWLLAGSAVVAGVSTAALAFVDELAPAIALRMITGLACAFAFPGSLLLAAEWLSPARFFIGATILEGFGFLGGAACQLALPTLITVLGGPHALLASGAAGLVVALMLASVVRHGPRTAPANAEAHDTIGSVLRSPSIWQLGVAAGLGATLVAGFLASWAPTFLEGRLAVSPVEAGRFSALGFIGLAIGAPLWGFFGPRLGAARSCMVIGLAIAGALAALLIEGPAVSPALAAALLFAMGATSGAYALVFGLVERTTAPRARGAALGLANLLVMGVGTIVLTPAVGGLVNVLYGSAKRQAPVVLENGSLLDDRFATAFGAAAWLYVLAPLVGALVAFTNRRSESNARAPGQALRDPSRTM